MESGQVTLRRALIGDAVRRYRTATGLTLREAATLLGAHESKLSRIETGQRGVIPAQLGELLTAYGIPEAERQLLTRLAEPGPPRWLGGDARLLPPQLAEFLAVEQAASELLIWAPCLVPEVLQVPRYLRSVHAADITCADSTARYRVGMNRQAAVREHPALKLEVVLGQAALLQQVAGEAVMSEQNRALATISGHLVSARLRIVPWEAGEHALAGSGPFTLARFDDAPGLGVVHLEGPAGGTCLTSPDAVAAYLRAFQAGRSAALSEPRSAALLHALADEPQ